jgi:hypothetical protein
MMVRLVASVAVLLSCAVARAQPTPAPAPVSPSAPAPAAYEPAVLGESPPAPPPQPPSPPPTAAAPSAPTHFPRYHPQPALDSTEQADLVQGRAALLRDRRYAQRDVAPSEAEAPVRHGDPRARWTLALSLDSVFYTDSGYDLFDDDNVASRLGVWAGYDLVQLTPRAVLAVELGFGAEAQEQPIWDGVLVTTFESQTFSAGASVRYALFSWLDPQLRASAGVTRVAFELDTLGDSGTFDDHAASAFGALGAGVMLHTPAAMLENRRGEFASFSFGVLIEGGYALRSSVDVNPTQATSDHAIPITQAALGELALSGPYVRSSVLVRF